MFTNALNNWLRFANTAAIRFWWCAFACKSISFIFFLQYISAITSCGNTFHQDECITRSGRNKVPQPDWCVPALLPIYQQFDRMCSSSIINNGQIVFFLPCPSYISYRNRLSFAYHDITLYFPGLTIIFLRLLPSSVQSRSNITGQFPCSPEAFSSLT